MKYATWAALSLAVPAAIQGLAADNGFQHRGAPAGNAAIETPDGKQHGCMGHGHGGQMGHCARKEGGKSCCSSGGAGEKAPAEAPAEGGAAKEHNHAH